MSRLRIPPFKKLVIQGLSTNDVLNKVLKKFIGTIHDTTFWKNTIKKSITSYKKSLVTKKVSKKRSTKKISKKKLSKKKVSKKRSTKKISKKKLSKKKLSKKKLSKKRSMKKSTIRKLHQNTSPSRERIRATRPSPSTSASSQKIGTVMKGNDGKMYKVIKTSSGTRRWVKN